MKKFTKICEDCKVVMLDVVRFKKVCNNCSIRRNRIQSSAYAKKKLHKCLTCEKSISKARSHCGAMSKKGSCAYKAQTQKLYTDNKKLYSNGKDESHYTRVTNKKRETACDGSGYF